MTEIVPKSLHSTLTKMARLILSAEQRALIAAQLRWLQQNRYCLYPNYVENQRMIKKWRNKYIGQTCVIIGNGPSMREFDLEKIAGFKTFCLNRGYMMWKNQGRHPDFLVSVNELVLQQFGDEIATAGGWRFVPWDAQTMFAGVPNTCFIKTVWKPKFHSDISTGAWEGGTVTFIAMQIAYHMGFSRVILLGVDHNFQHDGEPNQLLVADSADTNHFDPMYFGPGTRWHAPDLATSERAYHLAKEVFEADGREIVDATVGGKLRVFRRMDSLNFY